MEKQITELVVIYWLDKIHFLIRIEFSYARLVETVSNKLEQL